MNTPKKATPTEACVQRARTVEFLERVGHVVVLDVETTGFDPKNGRIVELALAEFSGDVLTSCFSSMVKGIYEPSKLKNAVPTRPIVTAPAFRNISAVIKPMIENADVLIGQNVSFDLAWIASEFLRVGEVIDFPPSIDIIAVAKEALPGLESYNLDALAAATGAVCAGPRHRALSDVLLEHAVFLDLITELVGRGEIQSGSDIEAFAGRGIRKTTTIAESATAPKTVAEFVDRHGELIAARELMTEMIGASEIALANQAASIGAQSITGEKYQVTIAGYPIFDLLDGEPAQLTVKTILKKHGLLDEMSEISPYRLARAIEKGHLPKSVEASLVEHGRLRQIRRIKVFPR